VARRVDVTERKQAITGVAYGTCCRDPSVKLMRPKRQVRFLPEFMDNVCVRDHTARQLAWVVGIDERPADGWTLRELHAYRERVRVAAVEFLGRLIRS
jgi:hypothetical protein